MILFVLLSISVYSQSPILIYKNNQAVNLAEKEKAFEAKEKLQNEVINNPQESILKYNLGKLLEVSKSPDEAIREYISAAKSSRDTDLQFKSFFNIAKVYTEKKDIPNALKYYQMALEINPDSIEVKTNIELLNQSSGGGGGSDDQEQNNENQDNQNNKNESNKDNKNENKEQNEPKQFENKNKPQPFKSQDITEQDVKRILEELKRQEDQIRRKLNENKIKEQPKGKDW